MTQQGVILVVDDDAALRESVCELLEDNGYRTLAADGGESALVLLRSAQQQPDLILLDLTMEDMSGLEVLEQLRQGGNKVPVIVISADVQQSTEKIVQDAGAVRFVGKPVAPQLLLSTVADFVGKGNP